MTFFMLLSTESTRVLIYSYLKIIQKWHTLKISIAKAEFAVQGPEQTVHKSATESAQCDIVYLRVCLLSVLPSVTLDAQQFIFPPRVEGCSLA